MIEIDTPGFLLTRKTAKIMELEVPEDIVAPLLGAAKSLQANGHFLLSRGYDTQGRSIALTRDQRGTHQAQPAGYELVALNSWLFPILQEYAKEAFFMDNRRLVKSQELYLWYNPGVGIPLHADDSTNGSTNAFYRVLTTLIYLNEDYTGGEIVFPSLGINKKPHQGLLFAFPGNKLFKHKVEPILEGDRYAIMQTYDIVADGLNPELSQDPCCGSAL